MMKTIVLLFCLSVTLGAGYSASNETTTAPTNGTTTMKSTSGSTTVKPTTSNVTTATTNGTTTAKTTTTTAKPTTSNVTTATTNGTTTTKTTTTTAKPTTSNVTTATTNGTTTAKTTTTTAKPTTSNVTTATSNGTTSAPPTTTSAPTTPSTKPTTPPPYGNFGLKKNGKYCLLAQFAVTFTIHYPAEVREDNQTMENATIFLDRTNSHNVSIDGVCGENKTKEKLILSWPKGKPFYNLTMEFSKTAKAVEANKQSGEQWRVQMIYLSIKMDGNPMFPNATAKNFTSFYNGSSGPSYNVGGYFSCMSEDTNVKFEAPNNYAVDPVFKDVKLEPFVAKNTSDQFGNEKFSCPQDSHPTSAPTPTKPSNNDIVPIAVGCALAGLVLIVLIAYIIGRRKSHRGYEKV